MRFGAYIPVLATVALLSLLPMRAAFAGPCANPTAPEGNMIFNDAEKLMQYCNGTNWIAMGRRPGGSGTVSSANLIGHWTLNGVSGNTTAADSSVNGFTGTLTNMNATTAWGAGQLGNSLAFDGADDFVRVPYNSTLDYTGSTITLSAWFNATTTAGDRRIVSMPGDEVGGTEKYALMISGGTLEFWIGSSLGWDDKAVAPFTATGSWHHVAGTYDGSNIKLYIDGTLAATVGQSGPLRNGDPANGPLLIGNFGTHWSQYFYGKIDDVRVYTRTLTGGEIAILAGAGGGGCTNPTGPKGKVIYNTDYHVPQFCNDSNWVAMARAGAGGSGCTGPVGVQGKILYNSNFHMMQYCDGAKWVAIGNRPASGGGGQQVLFLTSGASWTVPSDWNSSNNTIEVIGGGGGGSNMHPNTDASAAGGGGAYAKITNLALTPGASVSYSIGTGGAHGQYGSDGGDTWFSSTGTVLAKGGKASTNGYAAGAGGSATSSLGTVKYSGGNGGAPNGSLPWQAGGGGGGAGPNGAGGNGGDGYGTNGVTGAGGGGGSGGGSNGNNGPIANGGDGGNNSLGTGGGTGGNGSNYNGQNGTLGGGGGGARGTSSGAGGNGGAGSMAQEWDATHGSGSGGGGGGNTENSGAGGRGGAGSLYGGGGGGAAGEVGTPTGGDGAQGIIVITYTP